MCFNLFQSSTTRIIYCPIHPKSSNTLFIELQKSFEHFTNSKENLVDCSSYKTLEFSSLIIEELNSADFIQTTYDNSYYLNKIKEANGLILHFAVNNSSSEINYHCKESLEVIVKILLKNNIPILILIDTEPIKTNKYLLYIKNNNVKECIEKLKLFILEKLKCYNENLFHIVEVKNLNCYESLEWLFEKINIVNN
ncbi:hypothetical protein ABK040_001074 [Willaertia magna]